jgi:hypothetical protein
MHARERIPVGEGLARWLALLFALLLCAPVGARAATFQELVERPNAPRFGVHDSAGHTMDTLKVVDSGQPAPYDRYVGVYHFLSGTTFVTAIATSNDLVRWTYRANLGTHASQPTIARLATTPVSYWTAWEVDCARGSCIEVRHYPTFNALTSGVARLQHVIPRSMPGDCNEGTPNFFSRPSATRLDIGFHYNSTCHTGTDREARGRLTGLGSSWAWSATANQAIDGMLTKAGASGNHGDRDRILFKGKAYRIYEAQLQPAVFESFRPFLYDGQTMTRLSVRTSCGATAFANTSTSRVTLPSGAPGVFVAHFIFGSGAGTCGSGEMTYSAPVG